MTILPTRWLWLWFRVEADTIIYQGFRVDPAWIGYQEKFRDVTTTGVMLTMLPSKYGLVYKNIMALWRTEV